MFPRYEQSYHEKSVETRDLEEEIRVRREMRGEGSGREEELERLGEIEEAARTQASPVP